MQVHNTKLPVPIYTFEPDGLTGSQQLSVYHYEGSMPNQSELLIPHRKDYYLLVFVRHADSRQWIDMTPHPLKDNTIYFTRPDHR